MGFSGYCLPSYIGSMYLFWRSIICYAFGAYLTYLHLLTRSHKVMYAICRVLYRAIANLTIIRMIVPDNRVSILHDQSSAIYRRNFLAEILPANTRFPRRIADVNQDLLQESNGGHGGLPQLRQHSTDYAQPVSPCRRPIRGRTERVRDGYDASGTRELLPLDSSFSRGCGSRQHPYQRRSHA